MIFTPFKYSQNESGGWQNTGWLSNFTSQVEEAQQAFKLLDAKTADDWITKFNKDIHEGTQNLTKFFETCKDPSLSNYLNNLKGGKATVEGYTAATKSANAAIEATGTASKAASIGMKALSMAANVAIWVAITEAISLAVKGIEYLVTSQQRAIDKANELTSTYNSNIETANSNITTLQGLQDEFATLAKGVNDAGENVGLSAEQYKRYHEIVSQIVGIQPDLIKGYDSEGNAIVDRNSALSKAIELQKAKIELDKKEYLANAEDVYKGAQSEAAQAKEPLSGKGNLFNIKEYGLNFAQAVGNTSGLNFDLNKATSALKQFGLDYRKVVSGDVGELRKAVTLHDTIIGKLQQQGTLSDDQKKSIDSVTNAISSQLEKIDVADQKVLKLVDVWATLDENSSWYKNISSSGNLDAFNKQVEKLIQDNPSASWENIKSGTKKIGEAFQSIQSQIPTAAIDDLKQKYQDGKISADNYNKSMLQQITIIRDLATKYPGLSVLLTTLANNYADFLEISNKETPFDRMFSILSTFDTQEKSAQTAIDTLADSLKDLNVAIDDNQKGTLLSGDTVSNLLSKYPILYKSIIDTGNGYKFVKGALEDVRKAQIKEQEDAINAQIATAKQTLASTQDRIKAYAKEIGAISTLAQAQSRLAEMTQTTSIAIHDPNIRNGFDTESQEARAELAKYNKAQSELQAFVNASDKIKKGQDEISALEKQLTLVSSGNYQKTDQTAENKKNKEAAKKASENTALKNAESLIDYQKQMSVYTSDNLYKQIQLNQKYLAATESLKKYAKTTEEIREVNERIKSAQDELATAQKNYAQDVLNTSDQELQHRQELGVVLDGTIEKLQNLQQIYKNLTTNSMMSSVNTEENRAKYEKEIYDTKKGILEAEVTELDNEVNLGKIQEGTLEYLQRLQKIQSDISKSDLGAADKTTELQSINEKIYSARQSYNESQINAVDHLVSIGKLQENSLEYVQKLNGLYRSLNLTLEQRESLQEKIFSAEKAYISQLESDLMDESIEGSYGAQIKSIQDKIDAINKENDATSKQIALEKAQAALQEARNQKTISIFRENQGFVYEADQSDVLEKQQAVSDAKREEEIQKLTDQKDRIQAEADDMKNQLENVLHELTGSNKKSWDNIQDEISNVIDNVDKVFKTHTSKTKSYYNDIDNALDESTENTENDYQLQLDSAQNYFDKIQELQPKIVAQNNKIANSFQHIADALYNMNGQYDRMGRAIRYAEEEREQANIDYNEFNKSMKEDHQTIKYASGTSYSVGGLAQTDEEGYEWKLKPAGSGKYTVFDEGSMVFSAEATKNLWNLANNPQLAMLKAGLQNKVNVPNVTNKNSSVSFTIEKGAIVLHEVKDPDQLSEAIITKLPNQILQDLYKH